MKEKIRIYLMSRMDTPIDEAKLAVSLSEDIIQQIDAWQDVSLYFVSNNLYVNPTKVQNKEELMARLAIVLVKTREELLPKFEIRKKRYLEIIHKMSVTTRDAISKRINTEKLAIASRDAHFVDDFEMTLLTNIELGKEFFTRFHQCDPQTCYEFFFVLDLGWVDVEIIRDKIEGNLLPRINLLDDLFTE